MCISILEEPTQAKSYAPKRRPHFSLFTTDRSKMMNLTKMVDTLFDAGGVDEHAALILLSCVGIVGAHLVLSFFFYPAKSRGNSGKVLWPYGSSFGKNAVGWMMAKIARHRESKKADLWSLEELESFHKPDVHKFWNESYYWNGCDVKTQDRVITRLSHRGMHAKKMYVLLIVDTKSHGILSLEVDDVPVENAPRKDGVVVTATGLGISYECLEPMQKWRIRYKGLLRKGYLDREQVSKGATLPPLVKGENAVHVDLDMVYTNDSATFWYMRDEPTMTLAKNLSQEPWNGRFFQYCLQRSHNHCHVEAFGRMKGAVVLDNGSKAAKRKYDCGTFRDHSWDLRNWSAIDQLFILMVAFKTPLVLNGEEYWYLDITLVHMPGNSNGVQSFTTGYLSGKHGADGTATGRNEGNLSVHHATAITDIPFQFGKDAETREPLPTNTVDVEVCPDGGARAVLTVQCSGTIRRAMYWPDRGTSVVYEDGMDFSITDPVTGQNVEGYGTRQNGFRIGEYDPSQGGVG